MSEMKTRSAAPARAIWRGPGDGMPVPARLQAEIDELRRRAGQERQRADRAATLADTFRAPDATAPDTCLSVPMAPIE